MKIKVIYKGAIDTKLDDRIRKAMESAGFPWYAQGSDYTNKERDLSFDYNNKELFKDIIG